MYICTYNIILNEYIIVWVKLNNIKLVSNILLGYVGNGMLAAAVAGSIYAAPPSKHISYAIDRVSQYNNSKL